MEAYSPEPADVIERNSLPDDDWSMPLVDGTSVPPSLEDASLPASASASEANFSLEREKGKPPVWTNKTSRILENLPTRSRSDGILALSSRGDDGYDSRRSSSTPQPNAPIPRRGTKRPVAADFDSDPVPKMYTPPLLSRTGSGAGLKGYYSNPHVRHRTNGVTAGGFASLNSTRRCVIDVSDSEDETSEEELSPATGQPQPTPRDSALALELEIERMRRMIREREELKLRKQVVSCKVTRSTQEIQSLQMASNRSTPVAREPPGETRTSEETSEIEPSASASATATTDEVLRSGSCDNQSSENVLASASAPSSLHFDMNDPSQSPGPMASSPSPPGFTPLSSEDGSVGQVAVALLTSTGHCPFFLVFQSSALTDWFCLCYFLHQLITHAFRHPPSRSVFDLSIRIELQINPPRLQQTTKPSADQASVRYHLCDCHESLLPSSPLLPHHILYSLTTPDSCIRSVCYTLACLLHCMLPFLTFLKHCYASLRIGLRCFHRYRCRVPARISISGKDFPHPFCVDSNQPFLIFFFFFYLHMFSNILFFPLYARLSISRRLDLHCYSLFTSIFSFVFF
ncbi:hypothetical protein EI94DRAFT_380935 [Lactarius quietus]|nr:hypothetical protein EI94DRAFT_380935 [Lactarius quietus]